MKPPPRLAEVLEPEAVAPAGAGWGKSERKAGPVRRLRAPQARTQGVGQGAAHPTCSRLAAAGNCDVPPKNPDRSKLELRLLRCAATGARSSDEEEQYWSYSADCLAFIARKAICVGRT